MEGCEWGIFEWHQLLKGKWEARRDTCNTQIEVTLGHLDRLVKLQQARCFDPQQVEGDIETLLAQIRDQQLIEYPRASATQLDEVIDRFRQKASTERENSSIAEKKSLFYDMLADKVNVAVCHMTMCHFFTVVLAAATTIEESRPTPAQLRGGIEDMIEELLYTSITMHKMDIPLAGILSKLVTSWGALNPNVNTFVTKDSSLTELFAQELAYEFTRVYNAQLELLSISASHSFARAIISRMISIVSNGHLDLTRPVVEQLVAKLQVTVLAGHAKPANGITQLLIRGSEAVTVELPTDLQTQAHRNAQMEQYKSLVSGNTPTDIQATPQYTEAEIILRSGWEVVPPSPGVVYKLAYPKQSMLEELSYRRASTKMAVVLCEMGWYAPAIEVPKEVAPTAPRSNEEVGGQISSVEWEELKEQVQSQRQLITQQNSTLNHMNQLIKSLQQQLQAEKTARQQMEVKLDSLANQHSAVAPIPTRSLEPTIEPEFAPEPSSTAPTREAAPMPPARPPRDSPVLPRAMAPQITDNEEFISEEYSETASASYSDYE